MASVGTVSIFQEARDRIVKDIDNLIQCLIEKKDSLFREIAGLENEFRSKQEQKLCSLRKLESLKARTEEELGDNLLSEIQGRLTRELQTGINKISLEARSLSVDYSIQIDWGFRMGVVKDKIKEFSIKIVPNPNIPTQHNYARSPQSAPSKKTKKNRTYTSCCYSVPWSISTTKRRGMYRLDRN